MNSTNVYETSQTISHNETYSVNDTLGNCTTSANAECDAEYALALGARFVGFLFGIVLITVGLFGNLLVIVSILKVRSLRKINNALIASLAGNDILYLSINCTLIAHVYMKGTFTLDGITCYVLQIMNEAPITNTAVHLFLLTFYRYMSIVKPHYLNYITKPTVVMIVIALAYIFSYLSSIASHAITNDGKLFYFELGRHLVFKLHLMFCHDPRSHIAAEHATLFLGIIFVCIVYFYLHIIYTIRRSRVALMRIATESNQPETSGSFNPYRVRREAKLIGILFGIMVLFVSSYAPYVALVGKGNRGSQALYVSTVLMLWLNSSCNWIIYGSNARFRQAFKRVLLFSNDEMTSVTHFTN